MKNKTFLNIFGFIPVFAAFIVPLVVSKNYWYFFSNPKFVTVSLLGLLGCISFFYILFVKRVEIPQLYRNIFIFLGVFTSLLLISSFLGENPPVSLWGTFDRSFGVWAMILSIFAALPILFLSKEDSKIQTILPKTIVISSLLVALATYFGGSGFDIDTFFLNSTLGGGTLGNTTFAGAFLLFGLFFAAILFFQTKGSKKYWWGLSFLFILCSPIFINLWNIGNIITNPISLVGDARAAFIGALGGLVVSILVYLFYSGNQTYKKISSTLILVISAIVVFLFVSLLTEGSLINVLFEKYATGTRFIFWDITTQAIAEKPFLGWGVDTFPIAFQKYFDSNLLVYGEYWVDKPHNYLLEITYSGGFLLLTTYLAGFGSFLMYVLRKMKNQTKDMKIVSSLIFGLLIGYFFQNLFAFDTTSSFLLLFIAIFWFVVKSSENHITIRDKETSIYHQIAPFVGVIVFIIAYYFITFLFVQESKMFQDVSYTPAGQRVALIEKAANSSPAGGVYEQLYVYDRIYDVYQGEIGKQDQFLPQRRAEIEDIINYLQSIDFKNDAEKFRAEGVIAQFANLHSLLDIPSRDQEIIDIGKEYSVRAIISSPNNPLAYSKASQAFLIDNNVIQAMRFADMMVGMNPYIRDGHDLSIRIANLTKNKNLISEKTERARSFIPDYSFGN